MNGVPLRFDYSKTINEQLPTFEYYKDRYASYELEIMQLLKQVSKLMDIIDEAKRYNRSLVELYKDAGPCMELSNAQTNLLLLEDKEYTDVIRGEGNGVDN